MLQMGETPFAAVLDASAAAGRLASCPAGSLVSVTGIYAYQCGPPPSFRLLLRSPADVVLVSAGALVDPAATRRWSRSSSSWWPRRPALWVRMIASRHQLEREQDRAVYAERSRLARELHDTVEQGLAGITLQLEAVGGSLEDFARRRPAGPQWPGRWSTTAWRRRDGPCRTCARRRWSTGTWRAPCRTWPGA